MMALAWIVGGIGLFGGAYYAERHMKKTEGAFALGFIVGAFFIFLFTLA
jgi:hypothetical protein